MSPKEYDDNLRGVLFRNEEMRPNKKDPEYRGQCEIDGKQYWIDAWINEGKQSKKKYMSLRFKAKLAKDIKGAIAHKEPARDFDDTIPF